MVSGQAERPTNSATEKEKPESYNEIERPATLINKKERSANLTIEKRRAGILTTERKRRVARTIGDLDEREAALSRQQREGETRDLDDRERTDCEGRDGRP